MMQSMSQQYESPTLSSATVQQALLKSPPDITVHLAFSQMPTQSFLMKSPARKWNSLARIVLSLMCLFRIQYQHNGIFISHYGLKNEPSTFYNRQGYVFSSSNADSFVAAISKGRTLCCLALPTSPQLPIYRATPSMPYSLMKEHLYIEKRTRPFCCVRTNLHTQ